jgi:hypothetical protein
MSLDVISIFSMLINIIFTCISCRSWHTIWRNRRTTATYTVPTSTTIVDGCTTASSGTYSATISSCTAATFTCSSPTITTTSVSATTIYKVLVPSKAMNPT